MYTNGQAKYYQDTQVLTAKRAKLVLMMYDGAIRFAREAVKRIHSKDIAGRGTYIRKTQDIILELMNSLDRENGGEIAANLSKLYLFMNRNLIMANIQGEDKFIEDIVKILTELRDAWDTVINNGHRNEAMAIENRNGHIERKVAIRC
ncbi:MAG: flagellar export chaperone FliS [Nitrospinae bacterium]|nr:flagellar export chaperone FliS [Nitrospinota bacterium]